MIIAIKKSMKVYIQKETIIPLILKQTHIILTTVSHCHFDSY